MNRKINKLKNFMSKHRELRRNIMELFWRSRQGGNKKGKNGRMQEMMIEEDFNNCKKSRDKKKDNGKREKNKCSDKLTSGTDKIKNLISSLKKCKPMLKGLTST